MNVPDLLAAALALLDDAVQDTATVWPLGAAVLTRQAIEATAGAFWAKTIPAMRDATTAEQWLALPCYLGALPELRAAEYAWSALSQACHHREYDVGLTEPELRAHLRAAEAFRAAVGEESPPRRSYDRCVEFDLFAGIGVSDYATARPWYERLLGSEPSFLPHDTEAVWELAEHRFLYIVEDAARAGHALHTIFVGDLDALVSQIASRGISPDERETYSNGVRKVIYRDSEGNEIGFGGAPA